MNSADLLKEVRATLLACALERGALRFGEFILKSRRKSPYFFNSGLINDGKGIAIVGNAFANAILYASVPAFPAFDVLYGPPYKGIPLATTMSIALHGWYHLNRGVAYSRKEAKDHGEGGVLVGADIKGKRVLIVDDVITAGTAIEDSMRIVTQGGGTVVGAIVMLDRQERGAGKLSAVQEVKEKYSIRVESVLKFEDILDFIRSPIRGQAIPTILYNHIDAMEKYREQYGA